MAETFNVEQREAEDRFVIEVDGKLAYLEYMNRATMIVFPHTEVPEGLEGRGVGKALAEAALTWAKAQEKKIVPTCPFVAGYIKRHPEYHDGT